MKTQIGTLTARRTNGDEYAVELFGTESGYVHGEINGIHVSFSTENGKPAVKMNAKETKAILGIDTPNGGAMYLMSDWKPLVTVWKKGQEEIAMQANIVGFVFHLGCDAGNRYEFSYDFPEGLSNDAQWARRKADMNLAECLSLRDLNELAERVNAKALPATGSSYYGWEFDSSNIAELLAVMRAKIAAREAAKNEKAEADTADEAEKFADAARTGNAVIISSSMVPCNSREEDCDHDTLTTYAMPDGTKKSVRAHAH